MRAAPFHKPDCRLLRDVDGESVAGPTAEECHRWVPAVEVAPAPPSKAGFSSRWVSATSSPAHGSWPMATTNAVVGMTDIDRERLGAALVEQASVGSGRAAALQSAGGGSRLREGRRTSDAVLQHHVCTAAKS